MKKYLFISPLLCFLFAFQLMKSQTKLTITSTFYSTSYNDSVKIKVESFSKIENQLNDSLFFFETTTKLNKNLAGAIKVKKTVKKNKIYIYIPINPSWTVKNVSCFNISLLLIYDPVKGTIIDASCPKKALKFASSKQDISQGLLDSIKYLLNNYIKVT